MIISKNLTYQNLPVQLDGQDIRRVDSTKVLGIIVQRNLKWDGHTTYLKKR
jgi:hypothetical protein